MADVETPIAPVDVPAPAPGGYASVTHDGVTVESNTESEADILASLEALAPPKPDAKADDLPAKSSDRNADGTFKAAKPRNDPQARIDQITAKHREAERERDALRAELAAERAARAPKTGNIQPVGPVAAKPSAAAEWKKYRQMPDAPKLADFDDMEDYTAAVGVFVADQRADERDARRYQETQQQQADHENRQSANAWSGRLAKARAADPDFDAKVGDFPASLPMKHYIAVTSGDMGPDLLLYLGSHHDDAQRIATLDPADAIREMARIEVRLEAAPRGPARTASPPSQAKPPIKPLGTTPLTASDEEPGEDASDDEWYRWNLAKAKRR